MNWRKEQKETYDEIVRKSPTKHQYIYSEETLKLLDKILPRKGKLLDIGCGTGHYAEILNNRKWYGVDISPESVKIAKKFYKKVKVGDITKHIPFSNNSFDFVLSLSTLHHVFDYIPETIKEVRRVLKKGGEFIIIDHDDRNTHKRLMHHGLLRLVPCESEKALNIKEVKQMLIDNKFKIKKVKEIRTMADQQSLKPHIIIRMIKVPLLLLAGKLGTKTKGEFLIIAKN